MSRFDLMVKRNIAFQKLRKISAHYGGDDEEWLKAYAREVLNAHPFFLDKVVTAIENMERECST